MVVALAVDLLGLGQQRLHAFAQLHERVAGVRLLDDAGDQLAHTVAVLLEHHVALRLADPLEDHLLGRLRGDPPEVVRRDVAQLDLVLEVAQAAGVDVRRLRDDHLAGLRVDPALQRARGLLLGLVEQLVLEIRGQQELLHDEVAGVAIHAYAGVAGGARLLLVGGEQRVLQRAHQLLLCDALLAPERLDGFDDLLRHGLQSPTRLERMMSAYGIDTTPVSAATVTASSEAFSSSPVNERRPSWSPRVRTRARRPTKRRKCSGLVSGRCAPGEETSSANFSRTSGSCLVTRSHSSSVTPSGWSMKRRTSRLPTTSARRPSTSGSDSASLASMSF